MKRNNITFFILFLSFIIISCNKKEKFCTCEADLSVKSVSLGMPSIYTGRTLTLTTVISNNPCPDCETAQSDPCSVSLEVEYRDNEDSQWQPIGFTVNGNTENIIYIPIPPIKQGEEFIFEDSFVFADPGQYRFSVFTDAKNEIEERDETNNEKNATDSISVSKKQILKY